MDIPGYDFEIVDYLRNHINWYLCNVVLINFTIPIPILFEWSIVAKYYFHLFFMNHFQKYRSLLDLLVIIKMFTLLLYAIFLYVVFFNIISILIFFFNYLLLWMKSLNITFFCLFK